MSDFKLLWENFIFFWNYNADYALNIQDQAFHMLSVQRQKSILICCPGTLRSVPSHDLSCNLPWSVCMVNVSVIVFSTYEHSLFWLYSSLTKTFFLTTHSVINALPLLAYYAVPLLQNQTFYFDWKAQPICDQNSSYREITSDSKFPPNSTSILLIKN